MIITITFNPAVDKTAQIDQLVVGGLNRLHSIRQDAGGKGINVSKTMKAFDYPNLCTGFLAGQSGQSIVQILDQYGIDHAFVWVKGNTRTNLKVLNKEMELTELNEPGPSISKEAIQEMMELIKKKAQEGDFVVLSGNVSTGVPVTIYKDLIETLKKQGIQTILDADGELFKEGIKARPYAIKPNRFELAQYFGVEEPKTKEETIRLGKKLLNEETKLVLISMGAQGALFLTEDQILYCPPLAIELHSSVGAGDAMVAAMAMALDQNKNLEELACDCMATSAGACTTLGTQPAKKEVVERLKEKVVIYALNE